MRHIKRNIYVKRQAGIRCLKKGCKLEVDSNLPTTGFCKVGRINYIVEHKDGKWIVNLSLTKAISKNVKMFGRE